MEETPKYPVSLAIDYPDRPLNKLTTGLRIFTIIPIVIVMVLLGGISSGGGHFIGAGAGMVFLSLILMLLFRQKYPRWWFDWNLQFTRFSNRVLAYFMLLRDEYPSTDQEQAIHIDIPYPDAQKDLNRWLPLIKWFLQTVRNTGLAELALKMGNDEAEARTMLGYSEKNGEIHFFEGAVKGRIVSPRGSSAFGWDPIFIPEGYSETFAELGKAVKNRISMRSQAISKLRDHLENRDRSIK